MSKKFIIYYQNLNACKKNDFSYIKKLDNNLLSNNRSINNLNLNKTKVDYFSKTTKNSPRLMNLSKANYLRNKSFNLKNYSKQLSKSNIKVVNSLDSTGGIKKFKFKTKSINLNIKTINLNLEIKKFQYENNDISNHNINYKNNSNSIYINNNIYNNNYKKERINNSLNDNSSNSLEKDNNKCISNLSKNYDNKINKTIYRKNKSKEPLNKNKISPVKKRVKCLSIKKKNEVNNNQNNQNEKLFNSLKKNFIKKNIIKIQRYNNNDFIDKIKPKNSSKDDNKNTTPNNNIEKSKNINKTKFNEFSFNNIPKLFQFSNSKKQTRNFNYHKKQPSLILTKTSNLSQCNFTESISLDNMLNQISINKTQYNSSNYNNSTTISNEKSNQYNNAISMYNKLINENGQLLKENNELKQNNYNLYERIKSLNSKLNIFKNILKHIISTYKNIYCLIINKYNKKEEEMKDILLKNIDYIKKIIDFNYNYSIKELSKDKKVIKITQQILIENKILRNLYNNLLLFDFNSARLNSNQSDNKYDGNEYQENINKCNIINEYNTNSNRSNKFFEEENNENNNIRKRSDTVEQKKTDNNIIDIFGKKHSQSRNYDNKNELNTNILSYNFLLKKNFTRKLNYKIKK